MIQTITQMQKSKYRKLFDVFLILLGTFCMSAPVKLIYEPMKMVMGGFGGFAIVVKTLWLRHCLVQLHLPPGSM